MGAIKNAFSRENLPYLPLASIGLAKGILETTVKPNLDASKAWLGIAGLILAYEMIAPPGELLSEGADRALKARPLLTRAIIGVTALHLANLLPPQIDPLHQSISLARRLGRP